MPTFDSAIGPLHYTDQGTGDAVVLIHGFAASAQENWGRAGWLAMLTKAGRRVVTLDLRGHGLSVRSHEPAHYTVAQFGDDVLALTNLLDLKKPDLIGFSLGARIALSVLSRAPERFLLGVLCGAGGRWLTPQQREPDALAQAFAAEDPATLPEGMATKFRQFADGQGQDRLALAAVARGLQADAATLDLQVLASLRNEVFVAAGRGDELAGDPAPLADALGRGSSAVIPGCGHMDCLVQPMFKAAVMDFLAGAP